MAEVVHSCSITPFGYPFILVSHLILLNFTLFQRRKTVRYIEDDEMLSPLLSDNEEESKGKFNYIVLCIK